MKSRVQRFAAVVCFLVLGLVAQGETALMVAPTSDVWKEIYDPAVTAPTEVQVGSELRAQLFGMLRAKATPETAFAGSLKSFRNWACFMGTTVDKAGKPLKHPPLDNDDAVALWLRTQDGWTLVAHSFGHSDAFFLIWPEQYGVPRELLGMQGD